MTNYADDYGTRETPQTRQADPAQELNRAGGYTFAVDDLTRLERFLILGNDGGTYYTAQQEMTIENAQCVERCLDQAPLPALQMIEEISTSGRAPKNDPALFALAIAAGHKNPDVRACALRSLPKVARIGTHLFHFVEYVEKFRGWGRGLRSAVGGWYLEKQVGALLDQVTKYKQRDGWSHRDLLRLSHPVTKDPVRNAILAYAAGKGLLPNAPAKLHAIDGLGDMENKELCERIVSYHLPREVVPTEMLNNPEVWEALLEHMPMGAMIRNLGKMSAVGLLKPLSVAERQIAARLRSKEWVHQARVHPIQLLAAAVTYGQGHGTLGSLTWAPTQEIQSALDDAFLLAFANVVPARKRFLLALDVSGSMGFSEIAGVPGLTPRVGAAAMAVITARTEPSFHAVAFTGQLTELKFSMRSTIAGVMKATDDLSFGSTDCSLPMLYALEHGLEVDAFVIYTDNETWAGRIHPHQALVQYREKTGIPAKLIVVGMTSTGFSIANPADAGMMDVVGFDTAAPAVMADFVRG